MERQARVRLPLVLQQLVGSRLADAEALVAVSTGQDALNHAIRAADLFMAAASQAVTKADANRLRQKILRHASSLHGNVFPQWNAEPSDEEFESPSNGENYVDDTPFTLSPAQATTFAGWRRPTDVLAPDLDNPHEEPRESLDTLFMNSNKNPDLVQDMTTDCSVVAGLSAAIKILTGKHSVLSSIIYPFDYSQGRPHFSPKGKYILRLNFNGCSRRVVIDDRLPASQDEGKFFVVDRSNPRLLWPALLEKAYLKVRGGYDFPGSNSGTDLWVLTGWIPEQVFLQKEDVDINQVWARIKAAHDSQDVVITIGTGFISAEEENASGLVGEHDYAVQSLDDSGGERRLLVKNPWCGGPTWTPASFSARIHSSRETGQDHATNQESEQDCGLGDAPGCLWATLEDVAQNFESMYLNWNPKLFQHRQDHHFEWEISPGSFASSVVRNPQFAIVSPTGGLVWVLVSRHFVDGELEIVRRRTTNLAAASRQLGFMSIIVFDSSGKRVQIADGETYRGPYVDSPQTLARLEMTAGKWYTIVVDQHEFPLSKYTFTLSTFSHSLVKLQKASEAMAYCEEVSIPKSTPLSILLSTDSSDTHVHVDLVWGHGKRVSSVKVKELVASTGEYRRGSAVADLAHIDPGVYTLVCSTFDAGHVAKFALRVSSMVPVTLEPIPAEAAGRLRAPLCPLTLSQGAQRMQAPLSVQWLTRASVMVSTNSRYSSTLLLRLSIVVGRGQDRFTEAVSGEGEFQAAAAGLRTSEFDMEPQRSNSVGMWLLIEGMGMGGEEHLVQAYIFSDSPVQVGSWETIDEIWH
uniref:Calpain catalytic domain-containing protein n=1 Tax=Bionectria ochroleuca TaxID=29856 RepID=A0A8H7TSI7_BIOOC